MDPEMSGIVAYPASADGILTRVLEAGKGDEVVLFLHGVGARADRWGKNLAAVAEAGYRCIAIDLPGHGFAQKGAGFQYGVPGYVHFVEAFLKSHGLDHVHLVGTSMGGHIQASLYCRAPSRFRSLTLVGATGMFPIGQDLRQSIAGRISDLTPEGIRRKLASLIFDPQQVTERLIEEEWRINTSPGAEQSFALLGEYFRQNLDDDVIGPRLAQELDGIRPLIVWGERDRSVPLSIGEEVAALLGAPLVIIPATAHAPYWEAPAQFNETLISFLFQYANARSGPALPAVQAPSSSS